ncbi:acetylcholine receptor subunit alpha-like 2 [Patella vulgata]|uniref:acetylcholine receptor subunit alpha-like 2 n=1 Tax=Patella vulgata TaxID=6465 RepID=UPI0024A9A9CC|nr:acetylcholine receptor subunit alpha-like 2 [Patella vulgata]
MKESTIWVPSFVVDNSVNDLSVISDESVLVRANFLGIITWWPPGIYKTACDANTFYFPFDTQKCQISLTSYGYTTQEVDFNAFNFAGEKIAFCLTMMLSYTVLVTLLSEQLPASGKTSSLLTIYMAIVMVLCALAVILAIWVIDLFHRKDSVPIPRWQLRFTESVLLKIVCRKKKMCRLNAVGAVKIKGNGETSPASSVQVVYNDHVDLYTPLTWKDLAEILDSVLFRVYFITVVLTTVVFFTRMVLNI